MPLEGAELTEVESGFSAICAELIGKSVLEVAVREASAYSIAVRFDFSCHLSCETSEWSDGGDIGGGTRCSTREEIDFDTNALMADYRDGIRVDLLQEVSRYVANAALESPEPETLAEHLFSHVEVCGKCLGHKSVSCPDCSGGTISCGACYGRGTAECTTCNGAGSEKKSCGACAGRGQIQRERFNDPHNRFYWETCDRCYGSGRTDTPCYACGQSGRVSCSNCGGSGSIACTRCGGSGQLDCGSCQQDGKPTGMLTHFIKLQFNVHHDGQPQVVLMEVECPEWLKQYVADVQAGRELREEMAVAVSWDEEPADVSPRGDFVYSARRSGRLTGIEANIDANGKACDCQMIQLPSGRLVPYRADNFLDGTVNQLVRAAQNFSDTGSMRNLLSCKLGRLATVDVVHGAASGHSRWPAGKSAQRLLTARVLADETYYELRTAINGIACEFHRKLKHIAVGRTLEGMAGWFAILAGCTLAANFVLPVEIPGAGLGLSGVRSDLVSFVQQGVDAYRGVAGAFVALFSRPTPGLLEWAAFAALGTFLMHRSSAKSFEAPTVPERVRAWILLAFAFLISSPALLIDFGMTAMAFMLLALLAAHARRARWSIWLRLPVWVALTAAYASEIGPQHLYSWVEAIPSTRAALLTGIANVIGILFAHAAALAVLVLLFARRTQWSAPRFWKWLACYGAGWYFLSVQIDRLQNLPEIASNSPLGIWAPLVLIDLLVLAGWVAILRARRRTDKRVARQLRSFRSAPFARLVGLPFP